MNKKSRMLALLAVFGILLVTIGATYAVFTYSATGETLSTIEVGSITFQYNEEQGKGQGISITNAQPVASNDDAKESNDYFEFTINSTTTEGVRIPYTITARSSANSTVEMGDIVNMYLTEVDGTEAPTALFAGAEIPQFNDLSNWDSNDNEKVLYTGEIPADYSGPAIRYRLRMWIDEGANLSGTVTTKYFCGDEDVTEDVAYNANYKCDAEETISPSSRKIMTSPYNDMEFSVTVNVYSRGASGTVMSGLSVDGNTPTEAPAGSGFDQQVTIPSTSSNGDIVSQVDGEDNVDVDITRTDETFNNPIDPSSLGFDFGNSAKVKRISSTSAVHNLSDYLASSGEWGDIYLKIEVKRHTTGAVLNTTKLKVTIEAPTATMNSLSVKNSPDEMNSKNAVVKPVGSSATDGIDYEITVPSDSNGIKLIPNITFNGSGDHAVVIKEMDSTFTETVATLDETMVANTRGTTDRYLLIEEKATNKGESTTILTKKVKLIKSTDSSFKSPSWYE